MGKDLISVIMPAYNAEPFISDAIQSVVGQHYKNWELLIIDDGSTDNTGKIIKEFELQDSRIKCFYQKNSKQGAARNIGILASEGKFLAFLDADDKWTENKLTINLAAINKNSEIDLIFSQGYNIKNGEVEEYNVNVKQRWDVENINDFLFHNQIPILSVLVKKESIERVGCFTKIKEIQNTEDYHLWMKLLINGVKFKSIPDRLFFYRIHSKQSTFDNRNTEHPIFSAIEDIYYHLESETHKKLFIQKLKWYIFKDEFHDRCVRIFTDHFHQRRLNILAFITEKILYKRSRTTRRILFHFISSFG